MVAFLPQVQVWTGLRTPQGMPWKDLCVAEQWRLEEFEEIHVVKVRSTVAKNNIRPPIWGWFIIGLPTDPQ